MKIFQLLFLLFVFHFGNLFAQSTYFKILERPYTSLYQRIALFPDGSVLVGDALTNGPTLGGTQTFYLAKFDPCGVLEWSKKFDPVGDRLLFDDIEISNAGEIFVMATDIENLNETLVLIKLNESGDLLQYRHFPGPWYEMFTYSLDHRPGRITVSGLLFYTGGSKMGAVFMFDENLDPIWSKQYEPFEAYGESILTNDGGVLAVSGNEIIRFDSEGVVLWSRRVGNSFVPQFSAPLEISQGFIFEENSALESQLFLIRHDGTLGWQSEKFPARATVDGLSTLPNGDALLLYNNLENQPCQLIISPTGKISGQKQLFIDYPLNASFTFHTLSPKGTIHLFGQAGNNFMDESYYHDFIARFSLDIDQGECFYWENFEAILPNDSDLPLQPLNVTITDADVQVEISPLFALQPIEVVENEICPLTPNSTHIQQDTLLSCDDSWRITLHPDLAWEDGNTDNPRPLQAPGTYFASMSACLDSTIYSFNLEKDGCACEVFLPNAISPNGDGLNDELRPFSNCNFLEMHLDIYDRWGGQVYSSQATSKFWDGRVNGKQVSSGVYVAYLRYRMLDEISVEHTGEILQDVVVIH